MLKKILLLFILFCGQLDAHAANLIEVYQRALSCDPKFQQAISQSLVTRDNVPISISAILPNISLFANPGIHRIGYAGTEYITGSIGNLTFVTPRNLTQRTYTLDLTILQPVFNVGLYANIAVQLENAKSACATLNAALQDLMTRVSNAYFSVLKDEEDIIYTLASKRYYSFQLKQINEQYNAGVKMLTDVYTARASYETSVAEYIAANKRLANDRENLRAITGIEYRHLSYLKYNIPFNLPQPNDINKWVDIALRQNWFIKAAQYSLEAAKKNITQQFADHFPTITLQSTFAREYTNNIDRYSSYEDANGPGIISDRSIGMSIDFPLFEGGGVVARTNQAKHLYDQQHQVLEENVRTTVNNTRQSFMNIVADISQIKADKQVINAASQSLQGTVDRYNAGVQTLLDVLNREEKLYEAQIHFTTDRYELVNNIILLKEAAGTLNFNDLRIINSWLVDDNNKYIQPFQDKLLNEAQSNIRHHLSDKKMNTHLNSPSTYLSAFISNEMKAAYKKLEDQNQKNNDEIMELKASLAALKKDLHDKSTRTPT